jgi:hypothetical protein
MRLRLPHALVCFSTLAACPLSRAQFGYAPEPYPYLNGGSFSGPPVPDSFDPLVQYVWPASVNASQLQCYLVLPKLVTISGGSASSFAGYEVGPTLLWCAGCVSAHARSLCSKSAVAGDPQSRCDCLGGRRYTARLRAGECGAQCTVLWRSVSQSMA